MNHATMVRLIAKEIVRRGALPPEEMAEAITARLELAVEMELELVGGQEPDPPRPTLNVAPVSPPAPSVGAIPPSPAVTRESRSSRVQHAGSPRSVPPPSPVAVPTREPPRVYRSIDELKARLYAESPEWIDIDVPARKGGEATIRLERNIILDVGLGGGGARLIYRHPKAPDDAAAFAVFTCTEPEFDLQAAMDKILADAVRIHSPRQHFENTRSYDPSAPISRHGAIMLEEQRLTAEDFGER